MVDLETEFHVTWSRVAARFGGDAVARLRAAGFPPKEIAQMLGLTLQNVYDHTCELRRAAKAKAAPVWK